MVREELVEGLKYAISKGENLPKAMMSFYNAGYLKEDIEEAARFLQSPQPPQTPVTSQPAKKTLKPVKKTVSQPSPKPSQQPIYQPPPSPVVQRVSSYEKKSKRRGGGLVIGILVFFLLLLLAVLIAVFLFRDELAEILGGIL